MTCAIRRRKSGALAGAVRLAFAADPLLSDRAVARRLGVSNRAVSQCRKRLEADGAILPRVKSTQRVLACPHEVCTSLLRPCPENDKLYEPVRTDDPGFLKLVADIRKNGLQNSVGVSRDGFVYDGNRRLAAVKFLRWGKVRVHMKPVSYRDDRDEFLALLKSCNTQRVKTTAEMLREGVVGMEGEPWQRLVEYREGASRVDGAQTVELYGSKRRSEIVQKLGLKDAIIETVMGNKADWPLSDRKVFYLLLNVEGLLRNDRTKEPFRNSKACYDDVTDMVTRLRIDRSIPFDCIDDETRPVVQWDTHKGVDTFIDQELDDLFSGYWRDLQQSQPNWIELLVEKNTVANALKGTAAKYAIPMTSGRGYSSLPPRKGMLDRFQTSGREKLVIVTVFDHDPEGEDAPNAFGVSLRDDFGLPADRLVIVRAALTHAQVQTLALHEGQMAKEDSSRYARFVERYGERCWELESVPTETLREIVEDVIRGHMDLPAFERELATEREEQRQLAGHRRRIKALLADF
jgi:hypothetical protein